MIYTFQINTNNRNKTIQTIERFCKDKNIKIKDEEIQSLASLIYGVSYMFVQNVEADDEDEAFDKVSCDRLYEELEITDTDYSDEYEREERARAKYEAMQEDMAMEEYYERKYGN